MTVFRKISIEELQAKWVGDPPFGGWDNYIALHGQPFEATDVQTSSLTVDHGLPCGCRLLHVAESEMPDGQGEWVAMNARVLAHWLQDRTKHHRCDLATVENPSGHPKFAP